MLDLALRSGQGPTSLADISLRQGISLSYLEQLFGKLRRHGLVKSSRGPGGGYALRRGAEAISVGEIIQAVDEVRAGEDEAYQAFSAGRCSTPELWAGLAKTMIDHLNAVSLASLAASQLDAGIAVGERLGARSRQSAAVARRGAAGVPNSVFALADTFAT